MAIATFLSLLLFFACQMLLQTTRPQEQKTSPIKDVVFVGKSKNLNNAKIQILDADGNKIEQTNLSEDSRLGEIPQQSIYLRIDQKESNNEL